MAFRPIEVIFSHTTRCNLACAHCDIMRSRAKLPADLARKFLGQCKELGVKAVGFTGGEPFLAPGFLCNVSEEAVRLGLLFDRIMTNGVWWRNEDELERTLACLRDAGYDGSICVSVDAFHGQAIKKMACFIKKAASVWRRPDVVSVAYVRGCRDAETGAKLRSLDSALKNAGVFVKKLPVGFSAAGKASRLKDAWDGRWFREDHCKGPGNAFFVMPNGDVKPCCGYANGRRELTIGNIRRDTASGIMKKIRYNRFVSAVFGPGLSAVRRRLEAAGKRLPGKTSDHCFFCNYVLANIPKKLLAKCLSWLILFFFVSAVSAFCLELRPAKKMERIQAKVVKKLDIPTWYHEGMFYDRGSIWLANGEKGNIWVVDTATGAVTSEIKPVADFAEALIKRGDGAIFTTEWYAMKLYRVRLEDGALVAEDSVSFHPAHPAGLVWDGSRFFVVTWKRGLGTRFELVELDADMRVTNSFRIRGIHEPDQLAWDGKHLWVSSWYSKRVYRIDTITWEITGYFNSPASKTTGIAWDGKYMWVTGTYADLYQMEIGK